MNHWFQMLAGVSASAAWWPGPNEFALPDLANTSRGPAAPLKALLVVAHPDDESECAGTLYRITHELGGVVDQVVVTDGGGGQNFSAPALNYYGVPHKQDVGKELPRLRRKELLRAGQIIGVRKHYFLDQKDNGYTLDTDEGFRSWDLPRVRRELRRLLQRGQYDVVLTLLPSRGTHGHHKTVALLALEAVSGLPPESRPALMGVCTGSSQHLLPAVFEELPGFPQTRTTTVQPAWSFDRRSPLALNAPLDHSIIVHWVIAEHKSQGMFQMEYGRHTHEHFWQFTSGGKRWESIWQPLMEPFAEQQRFATAEAA
jgi:LmbE family N-acetylglucosaminyl deacetylase